MPRILTHLRRSKSDPPGAGSGASGRVRTLARAWSWARRRRVVGVEQWAEIRRMHRVERLSIREIGRRTGLHRKTIRRALASATPPEYSRAPAGSKLDPFKDWICEQLRADPTIQSLRLREMAVELGYEGGKTIFDEYVREIRPRFLVKRTFQRTVYRPGELVQCDLWEPRALVPVGHEQTRRGWDVTAELCWSRVIAGALIFSKEAPDILWGLGRCLERIGALPEKLVWDREGAIHAGGGRPTDAFAGFCGSSASAGSSSTPVKRRPRGVLERSHPLHAHQLRARPAVANPLDFQLQLDGWCDRVNERVHRTTRAVPAERLAEERGRMQPLPGTLPDRGRRRVVRVPQQPFVRVDRNDYSIGPVFAGRRVEVRASQGEVT